MVRKITAAPSRAPTTQPLSWLIKKTLESSRRPCALSAVAAHVLAPSFETNRLLVLITAHPRLSFRKYVLTKGRSASASCAYSSTKALFGWIEARRQVPEAPRAIDAAKIRAQLVGERIRRHRSIQHQLTAHDYYSANTQGLACSNCW